MSNVSIYGNFKLCIVYDMVVKVVLKLTSVTISNNNVGDWSLKRVLKFEDNLIDTRKQASVLKSCLNLYRWDILMKPRILLETNHSSNQDNVDRYISAA